MNISILNIDRLSRTQIKKEAEKVCRIINSEFPSLSSTKISEFYNTKTNPYFQQYTHKIENRIETKVRRPLWLSYRGEGSELPFYQTLVEKIKDIKAANCGDLSKLCRLICNMNGIPSHKAEMLIEKKDGQFGGSIDHAIQILPLKKESIAFKPFAKLKDVLIIDPWLGFAEFAPKAEEKFLKEYNQFFNLEDGSRIILDNYKDYEPTVTDQVIRYFRQHFPQFIIDKKKPLIDHHNKQK